jgi:hypothetical protein
VVQVHATVLVVFAGDGRIERSEHAVGIFAIDPDMPIVVRLEQVGLVGWSGGIIDYGVIGHPVERGRRVTSRGLPSLGKDKILDRNELREPSDCGS